MNLRYPQRHAFADSEYMTSISNELLFILADIQQRLYLITYRIVKELSDTTIRTKLTHSAIIFFIANELGFNRFVFISLSDVFS